MVQKQEKTHYLLKVHFKEIKISPEIILSTLVFPSSHYCAHHWALHAIYQNELSLIWLGLQNILLLIFFQTKKLIVASLLHHQPTLLSIGPSLTNRMIWHYVTLVKLSQSVSEMICTPSVMPELIKSFSQTDILAATKVYWPGRSSDLLRGRMFKLSLCVLQICKETSISVLQGISRGLKVVSVASRLVWALISCSVISPLKKARGLKLFLPSDESTDLGLNGAITYNLSAWVREWCAVVAQLQSGTKQQTMWCSGDGESKIPHRVEFVHPIKISDML